MSPILALLFRQFGIFASVLLAAQAILQTDMAQAAIGAAANVIVSLSGGALDEGAAKVVAGAIIGLPILIYQIARKRQTAIIASAAALPQVTRIETQDAAVADAVPNEKVVAAPGARQ